MRLEFQKLPPGTPVEFCIVTGDYLDSRDDDCSHRISVIPGLTKWSTLPVEDMSILDAHLRYVYPGSTIVFRLPDSSPTPGVPSVESLLDKCLKVHHQVLAQKEQDRIKAQKAAETRKANELTRKKRQLEKLKKELGA